MSTAADEYLSMLLGGLHTEEKPPGGDVAAEVAAEDYAEGGCTREDFPREGRPSGERSPGEEADYASAMLGAAQRGDHDALWQVWEHARRDLAEPYARQLLDRVARHCAVCGDTGGLSGALERGAGNLGFYLEAALFHGRMETALWLADRHPLSRYQWAQILWTAALEGDAGALRLAWPRAAPEHRAISFYHAASRGATAALDALSDLGCLELDPATPDSTLHSIAQGIFEGAVHGRSAEALDWLMSRGLGPAFIDDAALRQGIAYLCAGLSEESVPPTAIPAAEMIARLESLRTFDRGGPY